MKAKLKNLGNHIYSHRGRYSAAATVAVLVAFDRHRVGDWNAFLDEHNLLEEFYTLVD